MEILTGEFNQDEETLEKPEEKSTEEILLEDILNELDITFEDKATTKKIKGYMQRGMARLEQLKGEPIDFVKEMMARELLFSYCRYGRSNAIEQFEPDFASQITSFTLEAAVANVKKGGTEDEKEV